MDETRKSGRVTIPTDLDVVPETLEILKKWGADAIRDCDGTDFPQQLKDADAKIYSTYYTTRKDNAWAKANPDEVQQCYIMTGFCTAAEGALEIPLMKGISPELMQVNTRDDIKRWWEVMDRTTGQPICPDSWDYNEETGCVVIPQPEAFHEYTVAFLAYPIWDRCTCTTPLPTTGKTLSTRSPLMSTSPRPTSSPWSVCASPLPTILMST